MTEKAMCTLIKDETFGNLLHGSLVVGLPDTPVEELRLFFDTKVMDNLWIALKWCG